MPNWTVNLLKYMHYNALLLWRTRAFWMRALLCWFIGGALLVYDEASNFDLRLKIRGERPSVSEVVIVDVNERDWANLDPESRNVLRPLKEVVSPTDAYFWNLQAWDQMLTRLLGDEPSAIGVTLFFGENIRSTKLSPAARKVFEDPRIVWGADMDSSGRMLIPLFASTYNSNVGLRGMRVDEDGIVRRFTSSPVQVPHLAARVAAVAKPELAGWLENRYQGPSLINFSGGERSFAKVSAAALIEGRIPQGYFKNKIVIVGSLSSGLEQVQTPLGRMSRALVTANIADNLLLQRSVARWPASTYLIFLALIMVGAIWVLTTYPQSVTLVIFLMSAMIWAATSAWLFDSLQFWLPVFSPLAQLSLTCIVFLSYQLALNERRTWRLEQEQRYHSEIEQLKTNFVSMMSHDLKTPIAKIQAICDRLLTATTSPEISIDLKSLRRSSDELHRYIQSILQVTKVEAKDFKIKKEVTDINESIERVVARLQPLAREKGLTIVSTLEPMFSIEADTTLIQEVIHNLIENAIKYTPTADPASGATGRIQITSQEKDDNVMVVVEDTGPGIDPQEQTDIWGKFTRGRNLRSGEAEVKGTGLGLYLVKYFIELHGGQVFLESALGAGTRIGFTIPIADENASTNSDTGTERERDESDKE